MTKPAGQAKPQKPYKTFPLTAQTRGQWCKKIGGKRHYYGSWDDPNAAFARFQKEFLTYTPASNRHATLLRFANVSTHLTTGKSPSLAGHSPTLPVAASRTPLILGASQRG